MKFSPDAKYFYMFLAVFWSSIARPYARAEIDLADPHVPGIANIIFNPVEEEPAEDPTRTRQAHQRFHVHGPLRPIDQFSHRQNRSRQSSFDFTPSLRDDALHDPLLSLPIIRRYTVAINGNRQSPLRVWAFDMKTRKLINKKEFEGRQSLFLRLSADGAKISSTALATRLTYTTQNI